VTALIFICIITTDSIPAILASLKGEDAFDSENDSGDEVDGPLTGEKKQNRIELISALQSKTPVASERPAFSNSKHEMNSHMNQEMESSGSTAISAPKKVTSANTIAILKKTLVLDVPSGHRNSPPGPKDEPNPSVQNPLTKRQKHTDSEEADFMSTLLRSPNRSGPISPSTSHHAPPVRGRKGPLPTARYSQSADSHLISMQPHSLQPNGATSHDGRTGSFANQQNSVLSGEPATSGGFKSTLFGDESERSLARRN
jgi:hypothetical protein